MKEVELALQIEPLELDQILFTFKYISNYQTDDSYRGTYLISWWYCANHHLRFLKQKSYLISRQLNYLSHSCVIAHTLYIPVCTHTFKRFVITCLKCKSFSVLKCDYIYSGTSFERPPWQKDNPSWEATSQYKIKHESTDVYPWCEVTPLKKCLCWSGHIYDKFIYTHKY